MPRPLVFGNGSLLVAADRTGTVRDLFWPHYAHLNHLNNHPIRFGVWVDGRFAWLSDEGWNVHLGYRPGTLVGNSTFVHSGLGVLLTVVDAVDPEQPVWVRQVTVQNEEANEREIRLFQSHDLRINESDVGDCALYHPELDAVIHFKDQVAFGFAGRTESAGLYQYATGIKAFDGFEGTWRDAEDGELHDTPISQGSVDSTISVSLTIPAGGSETAVFSMQCADSVPNLIKAWQKIDQASAGELFARRKAVDQEFVSTLRERLATAPDDEAEFALSSLLILDTNRSLHGGIVAANDSDIMATNRATYSYIWPRDGALTGEMYGVIGREDLAKCFTEWAGNTFGEIAPVFFQKYRAHGAFGASWHPWVVDGQYEFPFQQDETALTVSLDCSYDGAAQWEKLIRPACDFMVEYVDPNGLPRPSWDLWEERRGIHLWTVASVINALDSAAAIANSVSDTERYERYRAVAGKMLDAVRTHFRPVSSEYPARMLTPQEDGTYRADMTADASSLAACLRCPGLGIWIEDSLKMIEDHLLVQSSVSGVARYTTDYYFRRSDAYPGNPWVICTMWYAQGLIRMANDRDGLVEPRKWLKWARDRAERTGVLAEQYHPESGAPLSVSPLTWSHAEVVLTTLQLTEREREFKA